MAVHFDWRVVFRSDAAAVAGRLLPSSSRSFAMHGETHLEFEEGKLQLDVDGGGINVLLPRHLFDLSLEVLGSPGL